MSFRKKVWSRRGGSFFEGRLMEIVRAKKHGFRVLTGSKGTRSIIVKIEEETRLISAAKQWSDSGTERRTKAECIVRGSWSSVYWPSTVCVCVYICMCARVRVAS